MFNNTIIGIESQNLITSTDRIPFSNPTQAQCKLRSRQAKLNLRVEELMIDFGSRTGEKGRGEGKREREQAREQARYYDKKTERAHTNTRKQGASLKVSKISRPRARSRVQSRMRSRVGRRKG